MLRGSLIGVRQQGGYVADNVLQEQLWFTATTLGVNALLMSDTAQRRHWLAARIVSTVISVYAAYLILERSAGTAGKIKLPADLVEQIKDAAQTTYQHKARETWYRIKAIPSHFIWVACEFSGSFFYLWLVLGSCGAVWIGRGP